MKFQLKTASKEEARSKRLIARKIVLFVLLFALGFNGLCFLSQPVWYNWSNYDTVHGFYDEPKNTIETVFLGSSVIANGITPMELYADYGICAYNLGLAQQPMLVSYYWLKEAYRLHENTLKIAVLDLTILKKDVAIAYYRRGLDAMKFSSNKLHAVMDYTDGSLSETISFLVPLFSYHSRWSELTKTDFQKSKYETKDYLRGYNYSGERKIFNQNSYKSISVPLYYPDFDTDEYTFKTESLYYLKQIIDFCREHDIKLILMKTPDLSMGLSGYKAIQKIADEYNITYLDFNYEPLLDEIGFNRASDRDDSHLNYYGAAKLTAWFGKYLTEVCGATDVRGRNGYAFLEKELAEYRASVTDVIALKAVTDPAEYLSAAMSRKDYAVFIAVKDEASSCLTEAQRLAFSKLGLTVLSDLGYRDSYLAVIEDGSVLYEGSQADPGGPQMDPEESQADPVESQMDPEESQADPEESQADPVKKGNSNDSAEEAIVVDLDNITMEDVRSSRKAVPIDGESSELLMISYAGELSDGTSFSISSGGNNLGNTASVLLGGTEEAKNHRGFNIVVYDKAKGSVIDSAVFDTFDSSVRTGDDLEIALADALAETDDYTTMPADLQKLYLFNKRCDDAKKLTSLQLACGDTGLVLFLKEVMRNEDYCVFLSVKDEASRSLTAEVRSALSQLGLPILSKLRWRDSYLAVIAGGEVVHEEKDHGEEPLSISGAWYSGKNGTHAVSYKISSGGYDSGGISSVLINNNEYSPDMRGVNIVVWNVVTNEAVVCISFDSFENEMSLSMEAGLGATE